MFMFKIKLNIVDQPMSTEDSCSNDYWVFIGQNVIILMGVAAGVQDSLLFKMIFFDKICRFQNISVHLYYVSLF